MASDMPQELEASGVGPMQVFQHDESRTNRSDARHKVPHLSKERGLAGDPFESAVGKRGRRCGQTVPRSVASHEVEPGTVWRGVRQVIAEPVRMSMSRARASRTRLRTSVVLP